jgi:hypothetical protein
MGYNINGNTLLSTSITPEGASSKHQRIVATGGVITHNGQWRIHTFTSSGTFTLTSFVGSSLPIDYLLVGGGGGTGFDVGGGGGGGGVLSSSTTITTGGYSITVGGGGASGQSAAVKGTNGGDSTFNGLTAYGGGGGGSYPGNGVGLNGGCGGGAGDQNVGGGTGSQGYNGGTSAGAWGSGGGGGAGGAGANGITSAMVLGGIGLTIGINGRPLKYSGGGYGNSDGGTVQPTGLTYGGTYIGYNGFGANGTGTPNASPYSGNGGVVIIRYKIK